MVDELYNSSWMNQTTNPLDIITGIGSAISQPYLIGNLILLGFFLIFMILTFREGDFLKALLMDGFITTVLAVLLFAAGMISIVTISFPFVIFIIALLFYLFS